MGIPKTYQDIQSIAVNGSVVWDGIDFYAAHGLAGIEEDEEFVYITGLDPGTYDIFADAATFSSQAKLIEVRAGETVEVDLVVD